MPMRQLAGPVEPKLDMENIQGNVVAGFKKPFQTLLFFSIDDQDVASFKLALAALADCVATADKVLKHNREFDKALASNSPTPKATWMNLALSSAGLRKLRNDVDQFADAAFREGMVQHSQLLGDPQGSGVPGNPDGWKVKDDTAHLMVIVAADTAKHRNKKVKFVREQVRKHGGATETPSDEGFTLSGPTGAIEHFGYRDGVSQPGLRGRASDDPNDLLTPRPDPTKPNHGKGAQELVWPGEFVFGYRDQARSQLSEDVNWMKIGGGRRLAPDWARDGSYLVFRRLSQHVHRFHSHLQDNPVGGTADAAGARIVGRWPSGAPILKAPAKDNALLAEDNDFDFVAQDVAVCPGKAHIRKVNPRGDRTPEDRLGHRMLRRGITFGAKSKSTPEVPVNDNVERGLLFMAYMTSIQRQFEFVMTEWANEKDFHFADAGADALLGGNWVEPTGGGYYFAPPVSALKNELSS